MSLHYKLFKGAGAFEMGNVFVGIRDTRSYIFTKGMILLITHRTIDFGLYWAVHKAH